MKLTPANVLSVLARHIGRAHGVTADQLAYEVLGQQPHGAELRRLRACISRLREDGTAICGHPSTGYFIANSAEELDEGCRFLRARALHSLALEARLRKISLPDLIGQLHLPT